MVSQTSFAFKVVVYLLFGSVLHASSLREKSQMSRQLQQSSPTMAPSEASSDQPTMTPSGTPSGAPSIEPTMASSDFPSSQSTMPSSDVATSNPTTSPTVPMIAVISAPPTNAPSFDSTTTSSGTQSKAPFGAPSTDPSGAPSARPLCKIKGFGITGMGVRDVLALNDGDVFCVGKLPKRFKIKVITDNCVFKKVRMHLINEKDAIFRKTDFKPPYMIAGKKAPMEYEMIATPDSNRSMAKSITFTILRNCTNTEQDPL